MNAFEITWKLLIDPISTTQANWVTTCLCSVPFPSGLPLPLLEDPRFVSYLARSRAVNYLPTWNSFTTPSVASPLMVSNSYRHRFKKIMCRPAKTNCTPVIPAIKAYFAGYVCPLSLFQTLLLDYTTEGDRQTRGSSAHTHTRAEKRTPSLLHGNLIKCREGEDGKDFHPRAGRENYPLRRKIEEGQT